MCVYVYFMCIYTYYLYIVYTYNTYIYIHTISRHILKHILYYIIAHHILSYCIVKKKKDIESCHVISYPIKSLSYPTQCQTRMNKLWWPDLKK